MKQDQVSVMKQDQVSILLNAHGKEENVKQRTEEKDRRRVRVDLQPPVSLRMSRKACREPASVFLQILQMFAFKFKNLKMSKA